MTTDLGRVAYDAYLVQSGRVSLITGAPLPAWPDLRADIQAAWRAAADAVMEDCAKQPTSTPPPSTGEAVAKADEIVSSVAAEFGEETWIGRGYNAGEALRQRIAAALAPAGEARAKAVEECARVCDKHANAATLRMRLAKYPETEDVERAIALKCEGLAAALRALSPGAGR